MEVYRPGRHSLPSLIAPLHMATQYISEEDLVTERPTRVEHMLNIEVPTHKSHVKRRLCILREGRNVITRSGDTGFVFVYCPDLGEPAEPKPDQRYVMVVHRGPCYQGYIVFGFTCLQRCISRWRLLYVN